MNNATEIEREAEKSTLYIVATPIGNLSDMTERGKKILSEVDFIAAEDTRVSGKLLSLYGIKKPIVNYFEHNKVEMGEKIAERLKSGECCALITDAGTPAISDPGEDLAALCHENNIRVVPIPGASAAVAALSASGMPSRRFVFQGFLPVDKQEMREVLEDCKIEKHTMIFYEAPHRLKRTLDTFYSAFGQRNICICREITKLHEEIFRTTLHEAISLYAEKEPRGEYVIIIEGTGNSVPEIDLSVSVKDSVNAYIKGGMSKMDAIKKVAKERGVPKNDIYKEML